MTDLTTLRADAEKARLEINAIKNTAARGVYALDKVLAGVAALEVAPGPVTPPSVDIYANGTKYPAAAKASLSPIEISPGATVAHVPVTLDRETANTVIVHVMTRDGTAAATRGYARGNRYQVAIFRPGDPLTQTVEFEVAGMSEGRIVEAFFSNVPDGGSAGVKSARITAKAGAVNEPVKAGFRAPLAFQPKGALAYAKAGREIAFNDQGGPGVWSTSLSHGRYQIGNNETGYYGEVARGGHVVQGEDLILKSARLREPVVMEVNGGKYSFPFQASMLSAHRSPDLHIKEGSIEWVAKMPSRRGSWPALWFISTEGWPPEIDVFEGFAYNASWKTDAHLSTNLHGGSNNARTFTRPTMHNTMASFGLENTLDTEFHAFACTIEKDWITIFVDGVETVRYANPFAGFSFYPLFNVAVKAAPGDPYDQGSGDMVVRSLKIWKQA